METRSITTKKTKPYGFLVIGPRVILCIALVVITYLAITPSEQPPVFSISDKLNHLVAFWTLGLLLDFSFPESGYSIYKIMILLLYGLGIEITQAFLPFRFFSLFDVIADLVGLLSYGISIPLLRKFPLINYRWQ